MEEVSSSPPSPWPSPTKPPEVRKPRPFQPPLRKMENIVEQMKGRVSGCQCVRVSYRACLLSLVYGSYEQVANLGAVVTLLEAVGFCGF